MQLLMDCEAPAKTKNASKEIVGISFNTMWHPPSCFPIIPPPSLLKLENGFLVSLNGDRFDVTRIQGNGKVMTMGGSEHTAKLDGDIKVAVGNLPIMNTKRLGNGVNDRHQSNYGSSDCNRSFENVQSPIETSFKRTLLFSVNFSNVQSGDVTLKKEKEEKPLSSTSAVVKRSALSGSRYKSYSGKAERSAETKNNHHGMFKHCRFDGNRRGDYKKRKDSKHPRGCLFCKNVEHSAQYCTVYPDISSRIQFLDVNNLCHACAFKGHNADHCPIYNKKKKCSFCKSNHMLSICRNQPLLASTFRQNSVGSILRQNSLPDEETNETTLIPVIQATINQDR